MERAQTPKRMPQALRREGERARKDSAAAMLMVTAPSEELEPGTGWEVTTSAPDCCQASLQDMESDYSHFGSCDCTVGWSGHELTEFFDVRQVAEPAGSELVGDEVVPGEKPAGYAGYGGGDGVFPGIFKGDA